MKHLFFLLIFGLSLLAPLSLRAEAKNVSAASTSTPMFLLAVQRFFAGTTFHPIDARRVSFTLAPTRAAFHITF